MRIDDRRIAGLGGILFALFLVAGFTLFGPKGGHYSSVEVTRFMAQGAISFAMSVCLIGISTVGLIVLMAYFSETLFHEERRGRVMWASSLLAAGCFLIGWGLYLSPPSAIDSGGPA